MTAEEHPLWETTQRFWPRWLEVRHLDTGEILEETPGIAVFARRGCRPSPRSMEWGITTDHEWTRKGWIFYVEHYAGHSRWILVDPGGRWSQTRLWSADRYREHMMYAVRQAEWVTERGWMPHWLTREGWDRHAVWREWVRGISESIL